MRDELTRCPAEDWRIASRDERAAAVRALRRIGRAPSTPMGVLDRADRGREESARAFLEEAKSVEQDDCTKMARLLVKYEQFTRITPGYLERTRQLYGDTAEREIQEDFSEKSQMARKLLNP